MTQHCERVFEWHNSGQLNARSFEQRLDLSDCAGLDSLACHCSLVARADLTAAGLLPGHLLFYFFLFALALGLDMANVCAPRCNGGIARWMPSHCAVAAFKLLSAAQDSAGCASRPDEECQEMCSGPEAARTNDKGHTFNQQEPAQYRPHC